MHPYGRNHCFRAEAVHLALEEKARRVRVHSPAELRPFCEELENRLRVLGYSAKDLFAVRLALTEAAANAFRHGNRGDVSKSVHLSYLVTAAEVLMEVEDQGKGFDPNQVPDPLTEENLVRPGGRGLFLMRAYMSWVSFNPQGNRVTLCRQRSGP
jgi:serine/threonine-protein kinase RsbW